MEDIICHSVEAEYLKNLKYVINNFISNNYNDIVLKIHWPSTLEFKTILIISKLVSGKKKFIAEKGTYLFKK